MNCGRESDRTPPRILERGRVLPRAKGDHVPGELTGKSPPDRAEICPGDPIAVVAPRARGAGETSGPPGNPAGPPWISMDQLKSWLHRTVGRFTRCRLASRELCHFGRAGTGIVHRGVKCDRAAATNGSAGTDVAVTVEEFCRLVVVVAVAQIHLGRHVFSRTARYSSCRSGRG